MRVLESNSLTLLTTNTCTAQCAHCCMNSTTTRSGKLTAAEIGDYLEQAANSPSIRTIIFAGGEPLLLGEDLYASLRKAKSLNLATRVVTNGYWANSDKRALEIVRKLRDAGLDEINISIDDYHLDYIDAMNVRRAFYASLKVDFATVVIVHCTGVNTKFNAKELDELIGMKLDRVYDENGRRLPFTRPEKGPYVAVSNTMLQYVGRATVELRPEDVRYSDGWETTSRQLGGCPWAVRAPAISPSGHLLSCCGFEVAENEILDLGDLHKASMEKLLDEADNDLVLNIIATDGPFAIMDFLKEVDPTLPFRPMYGSYCELCQHIVTNPTIRQSLYANMNQRAPAIVEKREKALLKLKEDEEFEALYHASDPSPETLQPC